MDKNELANGRFDRSTLKEIARPGKALEVIYELMTEGWMNGTRITSITVRVPTDGREGIMGVIKAETEDRKPLVAFRTAGTPKELVLVILSDVENDRLMFKEEMSYEERQKALKGSEKGKSG